METLSERFNALQDQLMDIYESGREDLETQIAHWQLLRQEQILLHYARKHGVLRIGYQPVPALATSEQKAKDAIGMVLVLQSLQKSPYGQERWTLVQTSLETFRNPPANCFKKGPMNIEVYFDGDPENLMVYTVWSDIYYQTVEDTWEKTKGHVDYNGAYFMEGSFKNYYIEFASDARRFSHSGQWEVHVNKDTVFAPVTSSSSSAGDGTVPSPVDTVPGPRQRSPERISSRTDSRRYRRTASSPTNTTRRQERQKEPSRRSRSRSRGRQEASRGGQRRRRTRSSSRDTAVSSDTGRGGRGGRAPITRSQSRSRSRSRARGDSAGYGIAPADVGTSLRSVGREHSTRLERLLADAKDPPVVLLRGDANSLKCYRYRAKQKHRGLVKYISTTWSWVGGENSDRIGRSRLLIAFSTYKHREQFLQTMKLPPKVDWSLGSFDDL